MTGLLLLALAAAPMASFAGEHGGTQEHGGATSAAPAAATTQEHGGSEQGSATAVTPAAPAAPAPDAALPVTPPAPPALKPIIITFSGELGAVNTSASPAMITVQDRYGVKKEISVPAQASIAQGTLSRALSDLKVGDRLTVEYTYDVATGKRTAQNIALGEAAAAGQ